MYAAAMDCTIAAAFSIICCPCQLPSCVAVAVAVCPRPATAAGVPGRFSALGPLFYGGPLALLHLPLPLGQLPVMLADNGLGLAVGGCKCLHIGITLRLDDGGKRIHPVADFLLCLLYLPSDVFALSGLKDARGGGKLLLQVWQHILLQVSDARGLVPHSYHQTSHGTELCHINVQRGLRRHCPLADQPLQEGPGLAHGSTPDGRRCPL